ncbi:hypothetical protein M422DRAFT_245511 [Sphaerobolus stellatus SS14]|nr:hypothetical protein M422DRAFT_245511 [Sphaerobolus stellatus SS14]
MSTEYRSKQQEEWTSISPVRDSDIAARFQQIYQDLDGLESSAEFETPKKTVRRMSRSPGTGSSTIVSKNSFGILEQSNENIENDEQGVSSEQSTTVGKSKKKQNRDSREQVRLRKARWTMEGSTSGGSKLSIEQEAEAYKAETAIKPSSKPRLTEYPIQAQSVTVMLSAQEDQEEENEDNKERKFTTSEKEKWKADSPQSNKPRVGNESFKDLKRKLTEQQLEAVLLWAYEKKKQEEQMKVEKEPTNGEMNELSNKKDKSNHQSRSKTPIPEGGFLGNLLSGSEPDGGSSDSSDSDSDRERDSKNLRNTTPISNRRNSTGISMEPGSIKKLVGKLEIPKPFIYDGTLDYDRYEKWCYEV